jgi:tight adherence protein C
MAETVPLLFVALAFGAVAVMVYVLGQYYADRVQSARRLPGPPRMAGEAGSERARGIFAIATRLYPKSRQAALREKTRRELLRAGFFAPEAVDAYLSARLFTIPALPLAVLAATGFFPAGTPALASVLVVLIAGFVALLGPDAYLARRRRLLARQFRLVFPDFIDLVVVCVDAGLTLDAAFDRISREIGKRSSALGMNLDLMGAERRAGRSLIEGLTSLADRLDLDEAGSLVSMLRQSIELGSDVTEALRVFSDDMREKRLLRAEEAANKLTVKMVLPLGLFIFPVILLVVMLPVMMKLLTVLK